MSEAINYYDLYFLDQDRLPDNVVLFPDRWSDFRLAGNVTEHAGSLALADQAEADYPVEDFTGDPIVRPRLSVVETLPEHAALNSNALSFLGKLSNDRRIGQLTQQQAERLTTTVCGLYVAHAAPVAAGKKREAMKLRASNVRQFVRGATLEEIGAADPSGRDEVWDTTYAGARIQGVAIKVKSLIGSGKVEDLSTTLDRYLTPATHEAELETVPAHDIRSLIARERAMAMLDPTAAMVMQARRDEGWQGFNDKQIAAKLGISPGTVKAALSRGRTSLAILTERIHSSDFDYAAWAEGVPPYVPYQSPLVYLAKMRADIPELLDMEGLRDLAVRHLAEAATIPARDKQILASFYHLDGNELASYKAIADMHGLSVIGVRKIIERTLGKLTPLADSQPATIGLAEDGETESMNELQPLPESDAGAALAMLRSALKLNAFNLDGRNRTAEEYVALLANELRQDKRFGEIAQELGDEFDRAVSSVIKAIFRYSEHIGVGVEGHRPRDLQIAQQYLQDVTSIKKKGVSRPISVANYSSPDDVNALHNNYSSISRATINLIIFRTPSDIELAVERYEECLGLLRTNFAKHEDVEDFVLSEIASRHPNPATGSAEKAVYRWVEGYRNLKDRWRDNASIPDIVIKEVALRWQRRPDLGLRVELYKRRKQGRSLVQVDERSEQRSAIDNQLEALSEQERLAVLLVFELSGMVSLDTSDNAEATLMKLCGHFGTKDLAGYVEENILPKLRDAATA